MKSRGFTLIELLIVIAVLAIIAAISAPYLQGWIQNARYRESAQNIASALNDARAKAIAANIQYRLRLLTAADSYVLESNANAFGNFGSWASVGSSIQLPPGIDLRGANDCSIDSSDVTISFNPDGTAGQQQYVCILDKAGQKRYHVGVSMQATGRIIIQRWVSGSWQ